jgi:hypothetical protein
MSEYDRVIHEIIKGISFMTNNAIKYRTTKIYDGVIVSSAENGKYNVKYNGLTHAIKSYGQILPRNGQLVKVIVPQGNQNLAWFFIPGAEGGGTGDGATFIPFVSSEGIISWTNDKGLSNPTPVNIKGPQGNTGPQGVQGERGLQGEQGPQGAKGDTGPYFTPSVNAAGDLSWTNNGDLENPSTVNIKGPKGDIGPQGEQGDVGPQGPQGNTGPQGVQGERGLQGEQGPQGAKGDTGPYFTPSVNAAGDLSWTNNGDLENPSTVNIKGPKGDIGPQGEQGDVGPQGPQGPAGRDGFIRKFSGSLTNSGWVQSGEQYYFQVTISDMTENDVPNVYPQWTNQSSQLTDWNKLENIQSFAGYVRFYATSAFTSSVNYIIAY